MSILLHPCRQTQFAGKIDVALIEPSNAVIFVMDVVSDVLQVLQVGPEQVLLGKDEQGKIINVEIKMTQTLTKQKYLHL